MYLHLPQPVKGRRENGSCRRGNRGLRRFGLRM